MSILSLKKSTLLLHFLVSFTTVMIITNKKNVVMASMIMHPKDDPHHPIINSSSKNMFPSTIFTTTRSLEDTSGNSSCQLAMIEIDNQINPELLEMLTTAREILLEQTCLSRDDPTLPCTFDTSPAWSSLYPALRDECERLGGKFVTYNLDINMCPDNAGVDDMNYPLSISALNNPYCLPTTECTLDDINKFSYSNPDVFKCGYNFYGAEYYIPEGNCFEETNAIEFDTVLSGVLEELYKSQWKACTLKEDPTSPCTIDYSSLSSPQLVMMNSECEKQGGKFVTMTGYVESCPDNMGSYYTNSPNSITYIKYPQCVGASCSSNFFESFVHSEPSMFYCKYSYDDIKFYSEVSCKDKKSKFYIGDNNKTRINCKKAAKKPKKWCKFEKVKNMCPLTCGICDA